MTVDGAQRRQAAAEVLQQAAHLDALVAGCLQDAVAQLQDLASDVLQRTADLQQWAGAADAPAGLAEALQPQIASLVRIGQFHDIFGQAAGRCRAIQDRRARLIETLVGALQEDEQALPGVLQSSRHLLQSCRQEQARHAGGASTRGGSVELF